MPLTIQPSVRYMTLGEAKEVLKGHGVILTSEQDLSDEGERLLYEILGTDMIFISEYPIAKRPFYHQWERERGITKSFDLIFKGIEITSGPFENISMPRCVNRRWRKVSVWKVLMDTFNRPSMAPCRMVDWV